MAILRSDEIRLMEISEMNERLNDLRSDLMKIKGVLVSGGVPEDVGKVREIRHNIARILTIKKETKLLKNKK